MVAVVFEIVVDVRGRDRFGRGTFDARQSRSQKKRKKEQSRGKLHMPCVMCDQSSRKIKAHRGLYFRKLAKCNFEGKDNRWCLSSVRVVSMYRS